MLRGKHFETFQTSGFKMELGSAEEKTDESNNSATSDCTSVIALERHGTCTVSKKELRRAHRPEVYLEPKWLRYRGGRMEEQDAWKIRYELWNAHGDKNSDNFVE